VIVIVTDPSRRTPDGSAHTTSQGRIRPIKPVWQSWQSGNLAPKIACFPVVISDFHFANRLRRVGKVANCPLPKMGKVVPRRNAPCGWVIESYRLDQIRAGMG
jgi:hypothetical protein